jgi:anti-sigma B factor antagonist
MGERKLEIIEERQNDINIYRLMGQLDTNTSQEFEHRLFKAITNGAKNLVLNLNGLHYISSAGIRVILKAINAIRRLDGRIMLCCLQDYVKEVFETSGVGLLLPIFPTKDEAIRAF